MRRQRRNGVKNRFRRLCWLRSRLDGLRLLSLDLFQFLLEKRELLLGPGDLFSPFEVSGFFQEPGVQGDLLFFLRGFFRNRSAVSRLEKVPREAERQYHRRHGEKDKVPLLPRCDVRPDGLQLIFHRPVPPGEIRPRRLSGSPPFSGQACPGRRRWGRWRFRFGENPFLQARSCPCPHRRACRGTP